MWNCRLCVYVCLNPSSHGIVSLAEAIMKGIDGVNTTAAYNVIRQAIKVQDGKHAAP